MVLSEGSDTFAAPCFGASGAQLQAMDPRCTMVYGRSDMV